MSTNIAAILEIAASLAISVKHNHAPTMLLVCVESVEM